MAVVAYHCALEFHFRGLLTVKGGIAVDFFFCLSGFVLAYAHHDPLRNRRLSASSFFVGDMCASSRS